MKFVVNIMRYTHKQQGTVITGSQILSFTDLSEITAAAVRTTKVK